MVQKSLFLILLLILSAAQAAEPTLTVASEKAKKSYSRAELLKRADLENITIEKDPAYRNQKMSYQAVKAAHLFKDLQVADDAVIQFKALDGFSAPLSKERLMNTSPKQSIAYVAIEPKDKKWPPLKKGKASAGPFYLVWKNPELSKISPEEWPFMLASLEVKGSLQSEYPDILPDAALAANSLEKRGFKAFVKNCFACHTMNKSGTSAIGPDLNVPMNPTEYLKISAIKMYVRNPQSLRHWPQSRMTSFNKEILPDKELDAIIAYLKHMSGRKKK